MNTLSIIVPAYNEEKSILRILEKLNAVRIPETRLEIIVVDDGSQDRTRELLFQNPQLYSSFIPMKKNGGKGAAVRAGLEKVTGEFVVFQDADLEYDPEDFVPMMKETETHDVILGSRFLNTSDSVIAYSVNRIGNRILTTFFNLLFGTRFTDCYTCYLMFRRSLVSASDLETDGWEQHGEILCRCIHQSRRATEVPIRYRGRTMLEGKKIRARHAIAVLWTMLRLRCLFLISPQQQSTN